METTGQASHTGTSDYPHYRGHSQGNGRAREPDPVPLRGPRWRCPAPRVCPFPRALAPDCVFCRVCCRKSAQKRHQTLQNVKGGCGRARAWGRVSARAWGCPARGWGLWGALGLGGRARAREPAPCPAPEPRLRRCPGGPCPAPSRVPTSPCPGPRLCVLQSLLSEIPAKATSNSAKREGGGVPRSPGPLPRPRSPR